MSFILTITGNGTVPLKGIPPRPASFKLLEGKKLEEWNLVQGRVQEMLNAWNVAHRTAGFDQHRFYIDADLTPEQLTELRGISPLVVVTPSERRSARIPR